MVNTVVPIAFLTTIAIGTSIWLNESNNTSAIDRPAEVSVISSPDIIQNWILRNRHTGKNCIMNNARQVSAATQEVSAEANCTDIFPNAVGISVLQSDIEGNISLANDNGEVLIEFGLTDDGRLLSISGELGKFALKPSS